MLIAMQDMVPERWGSHSLLYRGKIEWNQAEDRWHS